MTPLSQPVANEVKRAADNHLLVAVIEAELPKKEYPTQATLDKYGLTREDYREILNRQYGVCPICEKTPTTGRFVVDHDHVRGWKQLPPEERKKHVRGLLCFFCNKYYLGRSITIRKAENVTSYLRRHETRNSG